MPFTANFEIQIIKAANFEIQYAKAVFGYSIQNEFCMFLYVFSANYFVYLLQIFVFYHKVLDALTNFCMCQLPYKNSGNHTKISKKHTKMLPYNFEKKIV